LKYFVDYKDGLYPDSIDAYISFIEHEKNNPFKKNAYERIIEETKSDSLKLFYLKIILLNSTEVKRFIRYLKRMKL